MIYQPMPDGKVCRVCKAWKPLCEYHRMKGSPDGRKALCKICKSITEGHQPKPRRKRPDGMKWCTKCGELKALEDFAIRTEVRDGRNSWCNKCLCALSRAFNSDHRDERRAYDHERRATTEYRAYRREAQAKPTYRAQQKERKRSLKYRTYEREYRKKKIETDPGYRERYNAYKRNQFKKDPERKRTADRHRRSRLRGLPTSFTAQDWQRALDYWGHRCAVCDRPRGLWHTLAADHWIPLTDPRPDNPGTVPTNIIPLCHGIGGCNNSKSACDPLVWLTRKFGPEAAQQKAAEIDAYFEWVRQQDNHF